VTCSHLIHACLFPLGVHVLQQMCGCEVDDDGITRGYFQFGYDGADFLSLDKSTRTWTAANQKVVITKLKWDATRKTHALSGLRLPPSVSLLQKTPSSPVTCHATGFYPSGVMVFWQKDGQEHCEDVEHGETLQNDDGTFQKSAHLTVKPEEWKNNKYQCVVQVTGINKDFFKVLTESEIQTNRGKTNRGKRERFNYTLYPTFLLNVPNIPNLSSLICSVKLPF
uniref:Ig-like domain-containing protein n=1 Tax=Hucho hucho TaxID=62062 RepID=A0A4W5LJD0_9TELE